ncbi:MAG TPA: glycosyltransferase [Patescibacteria group bacterium]|nr:glycosyltransferase [Patescibacteria group bacterium]
MKAQKTTFIATVLNEEKTIRKFLLSIFNQTIQPDEIIITDGGSKDKTVEIIKKFSKENKYPIVVLEKKGNRAVGRNFAIEKAKNDIIFCSDAGCVLDKNWMKNISKPLENKKVEVVAGYYRGKATNVFQKCIIPYVLVMPDKVTPKSFLPATRSMVFKKSIWKKVGGFPEKYSHNEDYVFAKRLKKIGAIIIFVESAFVYWIPPQNLFKTYRMFLRFAYGDMEAGIIRPKVILIFLRYFFAIALFSFGIHYHSLFILYSLFFILILYLIWSINKNYRYVSDIRALYVLPFLQIVSDVAVLTGTILGLI